jgi:hypothetical protein
MNFSKMKNLGIKEMIDNEEGTFVSVKDGCKFFIYDFHQNEYCKATIFSINDYYHFSI